MTSDGSANSHYIDDLQSRDNQGWKTLDLYDEEDQNGRYIRSNPDLDEQGYMGELLVENDKSTATKAEDTESGYSFDSITSKGQMEQFEDRNDDVLRPEQVQKLNWENIEKGLLTELNLLREQRHSKEVKGSREHEETEGNEGKNSEIQLGNYNELDRDGLMAWYFW